MPMTPGAEWLEVQSFFFSLDFSCHSDGLIRFHHRSCHSDKANAKIA